MNVDSPSRTQDMSAMNESPSFSASLRSASLNFGLHNNVKRPLVQHKNSATIGSSNGNGDHSYKVNPDFSFSTWNKENTTIPNSASNNSLYKSLTFNGSPSISRKSSVKKHLRKKSSTNMLKLNQTLMNSSSRRNSNSSIHGHALANTFHNNKQHQPQQSLQNQPQQQQHLQQHQHQQKHQSSSSNQQSQSHHHEKRHSKSNSIISISSNSIFHPISNKPSLDSFFNFSHSGAHSHKRGASKSFFSPLVSPPYPQISPDRGENASFYSSEENGSEDDILANTSIERFRYLDADEGYDNEPMDFGGSPLQRKQIDNPQISSRIKQFNLQRHRSIMQFSSNDPLTEKFKYDAEQLTSNINGLTVNSDEDEFNTGNSVLHKSPFQFSYFESGKIPRINVEQLKHIIHEYKMKDQLPNGKFCKYFDELYILDCRFKFEYDGGHIDGAVNISSYTELEDRFFNEEILTKTPLEFNRASRKLLIFHCEFSSHRGPMKADQLRYYDRSICGDFYPNLYYPDIIVLEGGYKDYYESEKTLHKTLSYVEMDHPSFKDERDRNLSLLRKESSLSRQNSRSSSTASLTRRPSYNSLKTATSSSILDFSMVNKVETSTARPSKRFLSHMNTMPSTLTIFPPPEDEHQSSTFVNAKECGLFGGFGNHNIDLDSLVDVNPDSDFIIDRESTHLATAAGAALNFDDDDDADEEDYDDDIGYKVDKVELSITEDAVGFVTQLNKRNQTHAGLNENIQSLNKHTSGAHSLYHQQSQTQKSPNINDGFKIPLPRPRFNRRNSLHSRSKTVSSFSYSNHAGMRSAPLLSTPEKANAKLGNSMLFQHNDLSVYSVREDTEFDNDEYPDEKVGHMNGDFDHLHDNAEDEDDEDDDGYSSVYSCKSRHIYTPLSK